MDFVNPTILSRDCEECAFALVARTKNKKIVFVAICLSYPPTTPRGRPTCTPHLRNRGRHVVGDCLGVLLGGAGQGFVPPLGAIGGVLGGLGPELEPSQLRLAEA